LVEKPQGKMTDEHKLAFAERIAAMLKLQLVIVGDKSIQIASRRPET